VRDLVPSFRVRMEGFQIGFFRLGFASRPHPLLLVPDQGHTDPHAARSLAPFECTNHRAVQLNFLSPSSCVSSIFSKNAGLGGVLGGRSYSTAWHQPRLPFRAPCGRLSLRQPRGTAPLFFLPAPGRVLLPLPNTIMTPVPPNGELDSYVCKTCQSDRRCDSFHPLSTLRFP